jgi:chemotaxis protein methyltransferase WspC
MVSCAVRQRMTALGLTAEAEYEQRLQSEREWEELTEALLVSETWFFREPAALTSLVWQVERQWAPANPSGPLRLLSIPCASGEEPFSMVMALLDAGFPRERLQVDAIDLSATALALAERGVYGPNSFRTSDLSFRARYFYTLSDGFLLSGNVRDRVLFLRGNLLDPGFAASFGPYDFIFCRNLLIYLHERARRQVLSRIRSLLAPDGSLYVGLAEQLLTQEHGLNPVATTPTSPSFESGAKRSGDIPVLRRPQASGRSAPAGGAEIRRPRPTRAEPLEMARRLADAGKLREAASLCEARLREDGTSAAAYYLLGLVREAGGEPDAAQYYRKALYLEPNHREALLQMALLAHKQGDFAGERLFRCRAERCPPGTTQA